MGEREDPFVAYPDEPCVENGVHHPYTAFNQGWDAREMGASRDRNPYKADTREEHWWWLGWSECDEGGGRPSIPDPPTEAVRWRRNRATDRTVPIGTIHCLACGDRYDEPPPGWDCTSCGGPVAQYAGTIHVGRRTTGGEG